VSDKPLEFKFEWWDDSLQSNRVTLSGSSPESASPADYTPVLKFAWQEMRKTHEVVFQPSLADWQSFRTILTAMHVWKWQPEYYAGMPHTVRWSVIIRYADWQVTSRGIAAYPTGFEQFIRALNFLVGGRLARLADSFHRAKLTSLNNLFDAAAEIGRVYDDPAAAIPELMQTLTTSQDANRVKAAASVLGELGLKAIPALPALLASDSPYVRSILHDINNATDYGHSPEAKRLLQPVVPDISRALLERRYRLDIEVRLLLLDFLRCAKQWDHPPAIAAVMASLAAPQPSEYWHAVHVFRGLKIRPPEAVPLLLNGMLAQLRNPHEAGLDIDDTYRLLAQYGDAVREQALDILKAELKHERAPTRWRAAEGLSRLGLHKPAEIVPLLTEALADEDSEVCAKVTTALGNFGVAAESAVPALVKVLERRFLRKIAAETLGKIRRRTELVIPELVKILLENPYEAERCDAAEAIGRLAPDAQSAIPALEKALKDPSKNVRMDAARALARTDPKQINRVLGLLMRYALSKEAMVRHEALKTLLALGKDAVPAFPFLLEHINDIYQRNDLLKLLAKFCNASEPAVPVLVRLLHEEKSFYDPVEVAHVLGKIGYANTDEVVMVLAGCLSRAKSDYEHTRTLTVIAEFGTAAHAALPLVETLLDHPQDNIRSLAHTAWQALGGT
jgi:HEAT repeat protein